MALARHVVVGLEKCLREHAGLDLPRWVIEERSLARMEELGLDGHRYLDLVTSKRGASELAILTEAVRVGETRFFRHAAQLDAVARVVIPALKKKKLRVARAWSVGCATGEEAFSLAMVLSRAGPDLRAEILATDMSVDALATAKLATYPKSVLHHVPPTHRRDFVVEGDLVRVRPEIARLVKLEHQNLAGRDQPRGFHLIFCRNVLIYFEPAARKKALEKLVAALEPGGFLFLGYSETLRDVPGLQAVEADEKSLWVKAGEASVVHAPKRKSERAVVPPPPAPAPASAPPKSRRGERRRRSTLHVRSADAATVATDLGAALASPGLAELTVDLDGAEFLGDDMAPVLRRAMAAAKAAGVELVPHATRPGAKRWLRRHRLSVS